MPVGRVDDAQAVAGRDEVGDLLLQLEHARALALEIAEMHPNALAMAKRSVNQTLDIMGQYSALKTNFETHHIGHASAWAQAGTLTLANLNSMRQGVKDKG